MNDPTRRRVQVTVNGKPYVVEVSDLSDSPITVTVNGRPYLVTLETDQTQALPADGPETVARQASMSEKPPAPSGPAGPHLRHVRAPMPGNILSIAVQPGDRVALRQQLCTLEAMKMMNAIRSPRDGVIASVEVAEGQAVAHGDVLFTFE